MTVDAARQNVGAGGKQWASKKGVWGWMLFDWAAQPFFTVITTFIFGPYIVGAIFSPGAAASVSAQASWGYGLSVAGFIIAILSPILGSISDQTGHKKRWIAAFAILQAFGCWMLWYAAPGSPILYPIIFFLLASVAAEFSTVFNDSMLPRLVPKADIGRVSNDAWGIGYAGGMIVLLFVVGFLASSPQTGKTILGNTPLFGLNSLLGEDARITGPLSAVWYLVFILPMFLFTPDTPSTGMGIGQAIRTGLSELKTTIKEIRDHRPGMAKFLIARMIYQDGVNALLSLGSLFAASMFGWSVMETGIFGIILNVVAIFGCVVAGRLDSRLGSKVMVVTSLILLTVALLGILSTGPGYTLFGLLQFSGADSGGMFGTAAEKAYIVYGLLIGVSFGPVQASSRAYMARSVSAHETGRYFGIYALAGRATSFVATFLFATITTVTGSSRLGMSVLLLFFAAGLAILATTPYPAHNPED